MGVGDWIEKRIYQVSYRTNCCDDLCKKGDPAGERYKGFYLLQCSNEEWINCMFHINGVRVFHGDELESFLTLEQKMLDRIKRDGKNPFKM